MLKKIRYEIKKLELELDTFKGLYDVFTSFLMFYPKDWTFNEEKKDEYIEDFKEFKIKELSDTIIALKTKVIVSKYINNNAKEL